VVSSEIPLQVVGVISSDVVFTTPGAFARSGAFLPLDLAEGLRVVQGHVGPAWGAGGRSINGC